MRSDLRYDIDMQRLGYVEGTRYQVCLKDKDGGVLRTIGWVAIGSGQLQDCLKTLEDHLIAVDDIAREETEMNQSGKKGQPFRFH